MIQYFYNPKGQSLIIYDDEKREIGVVERITSVRVFVGGEVSVGDFGPETARLARSARRDEGSYSNHNFHPESGRAKRYKRGTGESRARKAGPSAKQRICSNCGEPGHRKDKCPNVPPASEEAAG